MLAPARMPVAEGKKMENIPKKLPSAPRQAGTKFSTKMSPGKPRPESGLPGRLGPYTGLSQAGRGRCCQLLAMELGCPSLRYPQNGTDGWADCPCPQSHGQGPQPAHTPVAEETFGGLVLRWGDKCPHQIVGKRDHDDQEEQHLGLWAKDLDVTRSGPTCSGDLSREEPAHGPSLSHSFVHHPSCCWLSPRSGRYRKALILWINKEH